MTGPLGHSTWETRREVLGKREGGRKEKGGKERQRRGREGGRRKERENK
jgi:hypothetical protein